VRAAERTIRTGRVTGIRIDPLVTAALLAEIIAPSDELWLVSPWISDVPVLDNGHGDYDAVIAEATARRYPLSEVLAILAFAGTRVTVVTRTDEHNATFLGTLRRRVGDAVAVVEDSDVHEKALCGRSWLLTGSMNFTLRGMQVNDEAMSYRLDKTAAAQARIDFTRRWGGRG
jgi:phosphatidylserine/phosphatidylglycerophosphate/cardiolipin synthase-like enzyme